MWDDIQDASRHNMEILDDIFNALDEEQEEDESMRTRFRGRKYYLDQLYSEDMTFLFFFSLQNGTGPNHKHLQPN